jgi:predicted permease
VKLLWRSWRRLRGALTDHGDDNALSAELSFHYDMQVEENMRAGISERDARREARLKFGSLDAVKESYRDQRGLVWLAGLSTDLRYALRGLRKSPGFTVVAVLTLALGIGANTAIFSLVDEILLSPPGIRNPERVVTIRTRYGKLNMEFPIVSAVILGDVKKDSDVFVSAALAGSADVNYTGSATPQRLQDAAVTAEWFDVFGAQPYLGRVFLKEEDQAHANHVAVLSHAAWLRLFGGDVSVLGRIIELNQVPHRVIGVMPAEFRWPQQTDVWTPAGLSPEAFAPMQRFGTEHFMLVARTRSDASFARAREWTRLLTDRVYHGGGPAAIVAKDYAWTLSAVPFTQAVAGETRTPLLVLSGAVGLVLLIACSNIAGLLLARASARSREFAVRAALGAGRRHLLRSVLAQTLVLAGTGAVAGIGLAYAGVERLLALAPQDVVSGLAPRISLNVLLFCAATAVGSAILFGIVPAWQISRIGPAAALKSDDRSTASGWVRQRTRSLLVVVETALALVLLVGAGLFLRSFVRLQHINPGFEPRGVMTAKFWLPQQSYPGGREVMGFYRTVLDRLNNTPEIASAALGSQFPFGGSSDSEVFQIKGHAPAPGQPLPYADIRAVTADYFRVLGIPLQRGRWFTSEDRPSSEPVTVIDENLARKYWPGENPVGQRIIKSVAYRVIGVVGHVSQSNLAADSGTGAVYVNMLQRPTPVATIIVKSRGDLQTTATAIREAVREADPRQAVYLFRPLEDAVAESLAPRRFAMRLLGIFAISALLLAALGLYGVVSYGVVQRRREIGIRVALGAERNSVVRLVVGEGLRLAAVGVVLGILASVVSARLLQSELFGVTTFDSLTIAVTACLLLCSAVLASYLPARRALRVDPAVTLRVD